MPSMPKLLVLSLCAALIVAGSAEARRMGGGRSVGVRAPEAATMNVATNPQSAAARAITGVDTRNAVIAGVAAGAASAAIRNARADSLSDPSSGSQGGMSQQFANASPHPSGQSLAAAESRLRKMDVDLERERAAEALAVRLFDKSAEKAGEIAVEKPPVKTPAEIAREKKEAEEKAVAARIEEERKMKLAREQSCRIEPVMSDKAIANCRKIFRES